jgi:Type II secretory pathway, component ExeA (predicted ATPase)
MYEDFYGLSERPFSLTPNPRYVFYSTRYREAADELFYGIERKEGFMLLTGWPGTGKDHPLPRPAGQDRAGTTPVGARFQSVSQRRRDAAGAADGVRRRFPPRRVTQ